MRTSSLRTALVLATAVAGLALTGCSSAGAPVDEQSTLNRAAADLAAAQRAALTPLATRVGLLTRAQRRAVLAGDDATARAVRQQLSAYGDLAAAVDGAADPAGVHAAVDQAGLPLAPDDFPAVDGFVLAG
ncbi:MULTISPECIES: hypothetical protein [unclassified Modestobacter]